MPVESEQEEGVDSDGDGPSGGEEDEEEGLDWAQLGPPPEVSAPPHRLLWTRSLGREPGTVNLDVLV